MIDVGGTPIACTDTGVPAGSPGAETILFGHGLLFGGWMFAPQIAALRQRYRCVTIDWRGQGGTPGGGDAGMDTLTRDAVGLIERLEIAPVHWVGLSMGGFVGQRVAARHGELLRSLTLLGTSAGAEDPRRVREYRRLATLLRLVGIGPIAGAVKPYLFGPDFRADPEGRRVVAAWQDRLRRGDRAALCGAVRGVTDRAPVEAEITGITVPTLVVVGADDNATPPHEAERIAALIPGARLEVLARCGHTSSLERPDVITGLLERFLTGGRQ